MSQGLYIRHQQRASPKWEATFGSRDLLPELPWPGEVRLGWFWTAPGHTSLRCDRHITTLEKNTHFCRLKYFIGFLEHKVLWGKAA